MNAGVETVVCNLCGEAESRPFAERNGSHVVQCTRCHLVYVNPRPTAEALERHYNGGQSSRIQYYIDAEPADRRTFTSLLVRAEAALGYRGVLLDIGPNVGTALGVARERGWDVHGLEINEAAARHCRDIHGLDVRCGTLAPETYPPASFDLVLMADVIEHLPDPLAVMRLVEKIVRPGGLVLISTPNIAGWAARLLQIKPEEHLYYFAPDTMQALLAKCGLELVALGPLDRHHNLTAMAHSTTCGSTFQRIAPLFTAARRLIGDVVLKLPLRENLLVFARKPAAAA